MNKEGKWPPRVGQRCDRILCIGLLAWGLILSMAVGQDRPAPLLVMISVDGMRPDYVTQAAAHGAKRAQPYEVHEGRGLRGRGVIGVVPTVTYPSHTTLVTGVWPAKHGIWANTTFDPLQKNYQGWYWYAEDIRVPTLWDAAAKAGRTTASIQWPVTVGANITWNIPEIWRAGTPDDAKLVRALSTKGLLEEAGAEVGPYRGGIDATPEADEVRGKYAAWILEKKHPGLLTLHLIALDHIEHETGAFSAESVATMERLDAVIGKVWEAAERVAPGRAIVAVVSDHGFANYDQQLNLFPAFREAGFITTNDKGGITDWVAMPWETGGSAAIVLKNPQDQVIVARVRDLLAKLAADSANGIDRVLDAEELHKRGGYPNASFFCEFETGMEDGCVVDGARRGKGEAGGHAWRIAGRAGFARIVFRVWAGSACGKRFGTDGYA